MSKFIIEKSLADSDINFEVLTRKEAQTTVKTWKKTEVRAMVYPKRSKEKSPNAAMMTPKAVTRTERDT